MPLGYKNSDFAELPGSAGLCCIKAERSVLSIKVPCFNMRKCSSSHLQTVLSLLKKKKKKKSSGFVYFFSLRSSPAFSLSSARGHYGYTSKTQKRSNLLPFQHFCDIFPVSVLILIFAFLAETCIHLYQVSRNSVCVNRNKISLFRFWYQ